MKKLMIFDFDGTLYRGDEPFRYYARLAAQAMPSNTAQKYLQNLEFYLQGRFPLDVEDPWEAVVALGQALLQGTAANDSATSAEVAATTERDFWEAAFLKTRDYMLEDLCPLEVPPALVEFLKDARGLATLVVASNSPPQATIPLLAKLQLSDYFDMIQTETNKPIGLLPLVGRLDPDDVIPKYLIMSVGDNYRNEIAPARQAGWQTAYINPRNEFRGPCTHQGRTIEELIPALQAWLTSSENHTVGK